MSTVPSKGYNPNILDINDPRFTALSNHADRWLMANMIGEGDVYYGRGFEPVYCFNTASADIAAGDFVALGNRCGRVTAVTKGLTSTSDGKVESITVYEDMRYLPLDYREDAEAFGYDDDTNKVGRTTVYVFGRDTEVDGIRNGSNVVLFQGSMMVFRQPTDDVATWNTVAQAAKLQQAKFDVPQNALALTFDDVEDTEFVLNWLATIVTGAVASWRIYMDGENYATIPSPLTLTFLVDELTAETIYKMFVVGLNADGEIIVTSNLVEVETASA